MLFVLYLIVVNQVVFMLWTMDYGFWFKFWILDYLSLNLVKCYIVTCDFAWTMDFGLILDYEFGLN